MDDIKDDEDIEEPGELTKRTFAVGVSPESKLPVDMKVNRQHMLSINSL